MRSIISALAIILAAVTAATAQSKPEIDTFDARLAKTQKCRFSPNTLIGLSRDQLRAKCGIWSASNITTTATGRSEQLIFNILPHTVAFYVYLTNDVVTAVQSR